MKIRRGEIVKDILTILAVAGILAVAATSPYFLCNIAKGIIKNNKYNKNKKYGEKDVEKLSRSLAGLNRNKLIIIKNIGDKFTVKLTESGKKIVREIEFANMKIEKPKVWDKKWRVIIFDIPEKHGRLARDVLRSKLQKLGFYQMQKSVWVYPYPCEKEIRFLSEMYNINSCVNIITAENIYNDDALKKYFKLK
jgi:CRISPR-associated endonuclease Cas2